MRIGLVGWCTYTGLGTQNMSIAKNLPAHKWLIPKHPKVKTAEIKHGCLTKVVPYKTLSEENLDWFFSDIDVLLFCERFYFKGLLEEAKKRNVPVLCYVNLEWFPPKGIPGVSAYLAPTKVTYDTIKAENHTAPVFYTPIAIDLDQLPFKKRITCQKYLFVHGFGGHSGRKATEVVFESVLRAKVPFIIYAQRKLRIPFELRKFCDVRPETPTVADLYEEGSVCVQPSRFEGIGLQLLECQACGLPLITSNSAPMNEYQPMFSIGGRRSRLKVARDIEVIDADVGELARVLQDTYKTDISKQSKNARSFIEENHSWAVCHQPLLDAIEETLRVS